MAVYFAVLNEGNQESSDAAVGTKPTGTSKILSPLKMSAYAEVEAASVADAQNAMKVAYGNVNTVIVVAEAAWKES